MQGASPVDFSVSAAVQPEERYLAAGGGWANRIPDHNDGDEGMTSTETPGF